MITNGKLTARTVRAWSIGSVSELTGVEVHTLRYWEKEFEDFLHPIRTAGGQRRYRGEDIDVIYRIKRLLRDEMFSIAGAKRVLSKERKAAA